MRDTRPHKEPKEETLIERVRRFHRNLVRNEDILAFEYYFVRGFTVRKTACLMGMPHSSVHNVIKRLRERARETVDFDLGKVYKLDKTIIGKKI